MENLFCGKKNSGYAAITMTLITLVVSLIVVGGFTLFSLKEVNINQAFTKSIESKYISESGIEDGLYRVVTGKQLQSSETLAVGTGSTTIIVTTVGGRKTIRSEGKRDTFRQNLETQVEVNTASVSFYYGVQVGEGGMEMESNAKVTGNLFSNGSIKGSGGAKITGDVIVAAGLTALPTMLWGTRDSDFLFATTSQSRDIAQSFTASSSGALQKVSVYLGKAGSPSDITARITTDKGGVPDDGDIASASIAASSVGITPSWIDVSFSTPPNLTSGTKYWIVLDYGANSTTNYWKWSMDSSDAYANNTGKYTADWSDKNAVWRTVGGDLDFRAWISGVSNKIDGVTIGTATTSTAYADLFLNDTVHGSACPPTASQGGNQYCIDNQPQSPQAMPLSDGVIQDFKDEAAAGGTISGDYDVTGDVSLGPKKITGDLNVTSNNKVLTVTGTIYVHGNISVDNGSAIRCAASYGSNLCIVLNDGWIHIKNNSGFSGSGQSGSFLMLLSTSACDGLNSNPPCDTAHHNASIDLHNNVTGAIFYAAHGLLNIHDGVGISEATAYKMHLDENANVTYDAGLANVNFSSGPSGGYDVKYWKEVE